MHWSQGVHSSRHGQGTLEGHLPVTAMLREIKNSVARPNPSLGGWESHQRVVSITKRKAEELEVVLESEVEVIEDFPMVIDVPEVETNPTPSINKNMKNQAPRTTSMTSVTIATAVPPSKKVKMELLTITLPTPRVLSSTSNVHGPPIQEVIKNHEDYCNDNLPVPTNSKWLKDYLNTVILWAGSQRNIFEIPEESMASTCQIIFDIVFPIVNYKINTNGYVFAITLQCVSEWKSNIGSTALALIIDFVTRVKSYLHQETAKQLLVKYIFVYGEMDEQNLAHPYHSDFILQLLSSTHLSAVKDYVDIPALGTVELAAGKDMQGVLVACIVVPKQALRFIRDGTIDVADVLASIARGKFAVKLPKVLNPATGKEASTPYHFAINNWHKEHTGYLSSINSKGEDTLEEIAGLAWDLLDKKPAGNGTHGGATESEADDRALICKTPPFSCWITH
ncbi:hypothetical protein BV22DRAFT_1051726 [Leucogyrophana mollusca]|uniref:Uncharacterized protein n=1 Tax=Leucogyrophana mollusca TaxID=85980 RepID=A0ACB8AYU1_9AGAM|nr:hypothetical protein BV22DRAFT_1051726 [Leucogyrophana mollusca]